MFFASAAFLTGLVCLVVPWWLHRLSAHASEQRTFSSLFLMRPSEAPVHMRRKLQHLWLLALRLLLLTVVCFAFAQPVVKLVGSPGVATTPVPDRVIVLDASLSMNRFVNGERAFSEAQQIARELVRNLPPGGRAALVSVGGRIELNAPLTADRAQLNTAISASEAGATRLVLDGLLGRIANLTGTLASPGERLQVHLISDFQASAMPDQFNALIEGSIWPVTLHTVSDDDPNWAVTSLTLRGTPFRRQVPGEANPDTVVEVTVRGFATPAQGVEVTLEQNGMTIGRQRVRVPADGTSTIQFDLPAAGRGHTTWLARLDIIDALDDDNTRRLVHADREQTQLPVITTNERPYAYLRAAVRAAAPGFVPSMQTTIDNIAVPVVVVADPGVLASGTERELIRFLELGGAVLLTAGPATRAAGRLPILDVALAPNRFDQTRRGVVASDRSHPVLAGFAAWRDLSVFQVVKLAEPVTGEVILVLDDDTPLLMEYPVGAGRLMVLTTALDPEWSSLVVRPAFVAFMANLLGYLAEDLLPGEALVGQAFAIPAQSVQLIDSSGARVLGLADTVGRPTVSIAIPGVYQLRTPSRSRPLAVNTDLRESDLRRAPQDLLARWQAATSQTNPVQETSVVTATTNEATHEQPLAEWLLALLAILVLAEPLLANSGLTHRREPVVT